MRVFTGAKSLTFDIEDRVVDFDGRADPAIYRPEVDWDALSSHYGASIIQPTWREIVFCLGDTTLSSDGSTLKGGFATSYDIQAARDPNSPVSLEQLGNLAAIGVTITADNKVLYGVRGGEVTPQRVERFASGLYGLPPGGSVTYCTGDGQELIDKTLQEEFITELGQFNIDSSLIGLFWAYGPGPGGLKSVSVIHTDATLREIQETSTQANKLYHQLTSDQVSRIDILSAFRERNLPIDAWEHSTIFGVSNDLPSIEDLLKTQEPNFSGIGAGALALYLEYLTLKKD